MSIVWYYVEKNERVGPVPEEDFVHLIKSQKIQLDTYVWKKGFENWTLLKEVEDYRDLCKLSNQVDEVEWTEEPNPSSENIDPGIDTLDSGKDEDTNLDLSVGDFNWDNLDSEDRIFTIRIGKDRGTDPVEYGPFSANMIVDLIAQKRVNGDTEIFTPGMKDYETISSINYFNMTEDVSPSMQEAKDQRSHHRAPLVARLFFHDSQQFFEGVCRDISIGGMQILVANFKGEVGDHVRLNVHPTDENLHFTAKAKIVRKLTECSGVSVRFIEMSPDNLEKINQYIELYED